MLADALQAVVSSPSLLWASFLGVLLGTVVGVLPGLGPVATMALLLPFTFGLDPLAGIVLLCGVYYGAMYGGSTTSILFRVPGETSSLMTSIDGYELSRQGKAGLALFVSAVGSFVAGTMGVVGLSYLAPPLARLALAFGPYEFLMIGLLGLTVLANLMGGSPLRNLAMALAGMLLTMVGLDTLSGQVRFTFGLSFLRGGFEFLPVVMGLYGISELIGMAARGERVTQVAKVRFRELYPSWHEIRPTLGSMARGGVVGFLVGLLPGPATSLASFVAYAAEKASSRFKELFGKGSPQAVAAVESANNSAVGGALVPLLALGIPFSPATAVLLSGFMIHGLSPGPLMLQQSPGMFWTIVASMYVGNVICVVFNLPLVGLFAKVMSIPRFILVPSIVAICAVGAYSVRGTMFDVWVMLAAGVAGVLLRRSGQSPLPLAIGMILGPIIDSSLRQSLIMSDGKLTVFLANPLSAALTGLCLLGIGYSLYGAVVQARRLRAEAAADVTE
ncbi:MAG: tripartite tricarboxylate transporter permease [Firmicutes bacterium]|nr:tripartite tricarboxylate transporter permease [Bacillota bacterium]